MLDNQHECSLVVEQEYKHIEFVQSMIDQATAIAQLQFRVDAMRPVCKDKDGLIMTVWNCESNKIT